MSLMPFQRPRPMSLGEFLLMYVDGTPKKNLLLGMLKYAGDILRDISSTEEVRYQPPEIRIVDGTDLFAEGMEGMIYVNSGLIEYYLNLKAPQVQEIIPEISDKSAIEFLNQASILPYVSFGWMVLHEYYHTLRRHSAVMEEVGKVDEVGKISATSLSIETDADMCAVARTYRALQRGLCKFAPDSVIKKLTLFYIYWGFRGLPDVPEGSSHPSTIHRIYFMMLKIGQLRSDPFDPPDVDASTQETKDAATFIAVCLGKCELFYNRMYGGPQNLDKFIEFLENKEWGLVSTRWDEIRERVEIVSGTKT